MKDDSSFDEDLVDQLTRDCFNSKDYQEGQEAFMNKRQPVFYGKWLKKISLIIVYYMSILELQYGMFCASFPK